MKTLKTWFKRRQKDSGAPHRVVHSRCQTASVASAAQLSSEPHRMSLCITPRYAKNHNPYEFASTLFVDGQPVAWLEYLCRTGYKIVINTVTLNPVHLDTGYIKLLREKTEAFHGDVEYRIDMTVHEDDLDGVYFVCDWNPQTQHDNCSHV